MDDYDWDLQAVVRGCRLTGPAIKTGDPFSSFPYSSHVKEEDPAAGGETGLSLCFPDLQATRTALPELEDLYRPFFPKSKPHHQPLLILHRSSSSFPSAAASSGAAAPHRPRQPHRPLSQSQVSRSKRRKNQQKRVVHHVPANGASADMWAWRKYGQKPIKGSPHPRGYYKCSSSKGCPARKQVERSRTDPAMLDITYTDDHNHPLPTHRSCLAASARDKLPTTSSSSSPPPPTSAPFASEEGENPPYSPPSASTASDELVHRPRRRPFKGDEEDEEEEDDDEECVLLVEDMEVMGEDDLVFMGMEDEGGTASSPVFLNDVGDFDDHLFPPQWLASNNSAAAASDGS